MATTPRIGINAPLNGALPLASTSEWNMRVDSLPVSSHSAEYMDSIGGGSGVHPDFGSGANGIPYVVVPKDQPLVPFNLNLYADEGNPGPYPIPGNAPIEADSDQHMIVVQADPSSPTGYGNIYETYQTVHDASGWSGYGAVFDGAGEDLQRPVGWTSADAAGLPIFPGLVKYDEVQDAIKGDGVVHHAFRITLDASHMSSTFTGSAEHEAGWGEGIIPFGTHLRLDPDYVIDSSLAPEDKVILQTLKEYGAIVADIGGNGFVTGAPDDRWDDEALHRLMETHLSDFQVVDSPHDSAPNGTGGDDVIRGRGGHHGHGHGHGHGLPVIQDANVPNPAPNPGVPPPDSNAGASGGANGEPDHFVFNVSQDAYPGGTQFILTIDDQPVTGVLTTHSTHGEGSDQIVVNGNFLGLPYDMHMPHDIGITSLNASDGTPGNVYLDSVTHNGQHIGANLSASPLDSAYIYLNPEWQLA